MIRLISPEKIVKIMQANDVRNLITTCSQLKIIILYSQIVMFLLLKHTMIFLQSSFILTCLSLSLNTAVGGKLHSFADDDRSKLAVNCTLPSGDGLHSMECYGPQGIEPCVGPQSVGTVVIFSCPHYYEARTTLSRCQENGAWSDPIGCSPVCGVQSPDVVPLIRYGSSVLTGQWPWAAALYYRKADGWALSCGGTLISNSAVVTAHCTWNVLSRNLLVVLGHLPRELPSKDKEHFIHEVEKVYLLPVYRGVTNSYNSDIAVIILKSAVQLSDNVLPACLPQPNSTVSPYTTGVVSGWGINEKLQESKNLHYIRVPIVDTTYCLKNVPETFTKHFSYTSFCAGYTNGTGVCNGDSGGGLLTEVEGQWVLQGIVSTSPRKGTSKICHPHNFSLYTKVKMYVEWIKKVLALDEDKYKINQ